jgi:NAD-dependent dihydropyrimidine dehydrogenase PreA subunit
MGFKVIVRYRSTGAELSPAKRGHKMAYYITQDCTSCGACEPECPTRAISQGHAIFIIDPERCTECIGAYDSPRCVALCSVDVCQPDPSYPETVEEILEKWQLLHPDGNAIPHKK